MGIFEQNPEKVKQDEVCFQKSKQKRRSRASLDEYLLSLGRTSIYSVDLNFISSKA